MAALLELNLDRFPTKEAMLTLLHAWLYTAERETMGDNMPRYIAALHDAIRALEASSHPVEAVAVLRDQQAARIRAVGSFRKLTIGTA